MIPKIIHYCWFGPKPLPRVVRQCIATWHRCMPDYELRLWNEQNAPMDHPFVQAAYAANKYAFVADYVRFWALYQYGGIYLDTDMYVVRSFDPLLDAEFFCAWETANQSAQSTAQGIVSCGALGACAKDILTKYETLHFDPNHLDKFIVPRIITPVILQHPEVTIYPHDYFYPLPYQERFISNKMRYNTANTYAVHLWDISWGKWTSKLRDKIIYMIKTYVYGMHK